MIADFLIPLGLILVIGRTTIWLLKKIQFFKPTDTKSVDISKRNPLFYSHLHKQITPSSFGVTFLIPLIYVFIRHGISDYLVFSASFLAIGLFDDMVKYRFYYKTSFWGLRAWQKLFLQLSVCSIFVLTHTAVSPLSIIIILSIIFIVNSYNITDGLDRLVAIPSVVSLFGFFMLEKSNLNDPLFTTLILTLMGYLSAFLIFNWRPALAHLGDSGALAIGFLIAIFTFRYNPLFSVPLIIIFVIEGGSSIVQIFSIKFFNRKVFKIAPLHLHLLNSGWSQDKIVAAVSLFQLVCLIPILTLYL